MIRPGLSLAQIVHAVYTIMGTQLRWVRYDEWRNNQFSYFVAYFVDATGQTYHISSDGSIEIRSATPEQQALATELKAKLIELFEYFRELPDESGYTSTATVIIADDAKAATSGNTAAAVSPAVFD